MAALAGYSAVMTRCAAAAAAASGDATGTTRPCTRYGLYWSRMPFTASYIAVCRMAIWREAAGGEVRLARMAFKMSVFQSVTTSALADSPRVTAAAKETKRLLPLIIVVLLWLKGVLSDTWPFLLTLPGISSLN